MQQNLIKRKLIVESPSYELEPYMEKTNRDTEPRMHVNGAYLLLNSANKNRRKYMEEDMIPAIKTFTEDMIKTGRAGGTLNHESSAEISLEKLCHRILDLSPDPKRPNLYIGKSMVLSSPSGKIFESLLRDGMRVGMSSRCLGRIITESEDNIVKDVIICSVDAVYEPSIGGSLGDKDVGFVNGILENKEYIISDDGKVAEAYEILEKKLSKYPGKHRDAIKEHIVENFKKFLASL